MNISIRKSKHQETPMTDTQFDFACECVRKYKNGGKGTYYIYSNPTISCDIYTTKTQISAVVYHG